MSDSGLIGRGKALSQLGWTDDHDDFRAGGPELRVGRIGPITLAFLAVQRHFISGITLGGVKGD